MREKLRAGSFVRIVHGITVILSIVVILIVVISMKWKAVPPLCFTPPASLETPPNVPSTNPPQDYFDIVCPTNADSLIPENELTKKLADVATRGDYIVVATIGMVAAGIASTSALRKIRGTSTAYGIPVALAMLKLPTGALTALFGLLLMRGAFIPGLSALDSSAQILAWAVVLGYSQELFTKFVDRQGQAVLADVHSHAASQRRPPVPPEHNSPRTE